MRAGLLWLATLLLLPAAGWPLLSHGSFRRLSLVGRAVLAGGVGAVVVSFAMTAFVLVGARWRLLPVAIASLLFGLALRLPLKRNVSLPPRPSERSGVAGTIACGVTLLAVLAALIATAAGGAASPDLLFFWGAKAQQFAIARTVDADFLRGPFHQYMLACYPPLVTNLGALATIAAGRFVWVAAVLTFPIILAALALGLPAALRGSASPPAAGATAALAISAIAYLGIEANVGGNAEMPLLFFETLAIALLLSLDAPAPAGELLAGLLLAGAASTKVEGLPFVLAAATLFLAVRRGAAGSTAARALRLLGPTAVCLGAWFLFGATRRLFYDYSVYGRLFEIYPAHWKVVLKATALGLGSIGHGLPYLVPLLCLLASGRPTRMAAVPIGVAAAMAGFLFFSYLHHAEDPTLWISWSAGRVFSPLAMLFALAVTCARNGDARAGERRGRPSPA